MCFDLRGMNRRTELIIAFDALPAFPGKSGAVGAFRKWMQILPTLREDIEVILFVFPRQAEYYEKFLHDAIKDRVRFVLVNLPSNVFVRVVAQNTIVPFVCWQMKVDVHLSMNPEPWFRLSRTLEVFKIADLQYLESPNEFGFFKYQYRKFAGRRKVHKSDLIIANSDATKNRIDKYFNIDPRKIAIIHESYDHELFTTEQKEKSDGDILVKYGVRRPFLLYVSSFRPYKNHYDLLQAYKLLPHRLEHKLVLVGNDVHGFKLTVVEMVENLGISDRVIMLDYIHHWELASFYRQAAIFIYPSKYETFGIPPLEAMACGCPVITSNYSCIPEIVENGAEIVDTANHGLFAEKMHSLLIDKKFRNDLIKRGGIQCKKYSWANNSKETLNEIMSRLLTKRKNG